MDEILDGATDLLPQPARRSRFHAITGRDLDQPHVYKEVIVAFTKAVDRYHVRRPSDRLRLT